MKHILVVGVELLSRVLDTTVRGVVYEVRGETAKAIAEELRAARPLRGESRTYPQLPCPWP